ncbi:hypothetical protein BJY04DRAFT_225027 [Aspergillus karnatakaensis]|uniref:uncharacterized protein n=1 Tax=Aspergillus karnatakaensis TaxID=1810916 RepID=UPI003CCE0B05
MLGVLKSGAAFVLLDPAHSVERLRGICRDVNPAVILTSGGDSVSAIKLVNETEKNTGLNLTVADVFQHSIMSDMSHPAQKRHKRPLAIDANAVVPPYSMLDVTEVEILKALAAELC